MNSETSTAVIGAGIVGLAVADALCRAGASVTVLDRGALAGGTTNNSFSWLNATSKTEDEAYHRLNAAGAAAWRALAREAGEVVIGLHPCGMIEWVDGANAEARADLERRAERLATWEYPARRVDRRDLETMEPHMAFPPQAMGIHAFTDAWLDPPKAASFLAERVREHGGRIFEGCAARGVSRKNGAIVAVETDEAPIIAGRVVIATGPDTSSVLAKMSGNESFRTRSHVNLVPGAIIQTPPTAPFHWVRSVVYSEHHGSLHIRPAANGGLLLGGDDADGWIAKGHDEDLMRRIEKHLLTRARTYIPRLPVHLWIGKCQWRVGVRPMPSDGHSIVGSVPGDPGLYVAVTHSGITLAPVIGQCLSDCILSGKTPPLIEPFGYGRFQRSA
jgi:glycine/D-amino acid oxidase-like deaminating enzyme